MKVKVNYNEMDSLIKYIESQNDKLTSFHKEIKNDLGKINECWKGKDSDAFLSASNQYINDAFEGLNSLSDFKNNLNKIIDLYKNGEENFERKIKES